MPKSQLKETGMIDFAHIPISDITPNPRNPRGINIEVDDPKMSYLKDSIKEFGVMVPIVVSKREKGDYLLIDGERRYWASKALGLERIPAYIVDGEGALSENDILFRMFQIHHNREQWGPVQQCAALEFVFQKTVKRPEIESIHDEKARIKAIVEEIVRTTGIEERTAINRIYFLLWPEAIKKHLYQNPEEKGYWYICEIEEKIIIPARENYPEYFKKVPVDEVRQALFEKIKHHSVDKATDVRKVAPFFRTNMSKAKDRAAVVSSLAHLTTQRDMTYAEAEEDLLKHFPEFHKRGPVSPRRLHNLIVGLKDAFDGFDFGSLWTAKKRAKAMPREIVDALNLLDSSVAEFRSSLKDYTR